MVYRTAPFSVTLNDPKPIFQGQAILWRWMARGNTANLCNRHIKGLLQGQQLCSANQANEASTSSTVVVFIRELVVKLFFLCQMDLVVFTVFKLEFGVWQGSVLSPILFAVYVDDLARSCDFIRGVCLYYTVGGRYFIVITYGMRASEFIRHLWTRTWSARFDHKCKKNHAAYE